eukprot:3134802-Prymnesium_polylepis.2
MPRSSARSSVTRCGQPAARAISPALVRRSQPSRQSPVSEWPQLDASVSSALSVMFAPPAAGVEQQRGSGLRVGAAWVQGALRARHQCRDSGGGRIWPRACRCPSR